MVWLLGGGFILAILLVAGLFMIDRRSIKSVNKAAEINQINKDGAVTDLLSEDLDNIHCKVEQFLRENNFESIDRIIDQMELFTREKQNLIRQTLAQSGVIERYKSGLAETDYKTRAASAERLGKIGGEGVSVLLFEAMADKNEEVRMAATSALKKLRDPSVAGLLIDALKFPNKWLPARIAEVLVSLGQVSVTALKAAMQDSDPVIRGYVVELLGEMGASLPAAVLYPALKDEHSNVRLQAARVLGKMGHEDSAEYLAELLNDSEMKVRVQAIRSLGKIGGKIALKHLEELIQQKEEEFAVLLTAFDSIKLMGSEGLHIIQAVSTSQGHPLAEKATELIKSENVKQTTKVKITYM